MHTYKHCISLLLLILFVYLQDLKDFYTFPPNFLALYVLLLLVNLNTFFSSITIYGLLSNSALNIFPFQHFFLIRRYGFAKKVMGKFSFLCLNSFENVESFKTLNNIIFLQFFILMKHCWIAFIRLNSISFY